MEFVDFENIVRAEFPLVSESQMAQFRGMDALYRDWNSKINVISRKDIDGLYEHHVLHSLGIAAYLRRNRPEVFASLCVPDGGAGVLLSPDSAGGSLQSDSSGISLPPDSASLALQPGSAGPASAQPVQILDLGTGGGFPGIPLSILMPRAHFTLCDSIGKKLKVASGVAGALGLQNVEVVNARAETLPQTFDYVVSRAVTTLEQFYPWVRGKFSRSILYLKGGDINEEVVTMMGKYQLKKGSVHCWKIDTWLREEYFAEKFVIEIEND